MFHEKTYVENMSSRFSYDSKEELPEKSRRYNLEVYTKYMSKDRKSEIYFKSLTINGFQKIF